MATVETPDKQSTAGESEQVTYDEATPTTADVTPSSDPQPSTPVPSTDKSTDKPSPPPTSGGEEAKPLPPTNTDKSSKLSETFGTAL